MHKARIGIVHNQPLSVGHEFAEASTDVVVQVEAIEKALQESGYDTRRIPFTKDLSGFMQKMTEARVEVVFNLCETVDEDPRCAGHPAAVLELMGIPFTGSPSLALMLTTDKLLTKRLLRAMGIRTPDYLVYDSVGTFHPGVLKYPVIAKPRYEDASIGIDQESVFQCKEKLLGGIEALHDRFGTILVEEYVGGREFNVSLFGYPSAKVLPVAEIDFREFPDGLFPIVGYRAKWDKSSFEYHHTLRTFPEDLSLGLLASIESTAAECFRLFMLRDYGRVDMRMDGSGRVNVLEVNANCCLSPDAGFAAAGGRAGMDYAEIVNQLLEFVMQRACNYGHKACYLSG